MNYDNCTKEIQKVGDNHVIIKYILFDKEGNKVIVKEDDYGSERASYELSVAQQEYDKWDKLTQKEIDAKKATAQKRVQDLNVILAEMDTVKND